MVEFKQIEWDHLFKQSPDRYLRVYDEDTDELTEVHDKENGNIWSRIDGNRWMLNL